MPGLQKIKTIKYNGRKEHFMSYLKGLSYEIDFENVDENGQILA